MELHVQNSFSRRRRIAFGFCVLTAGSALPAAAQHVLQAPEPEITLPSGGVRVPLHTASKHPIVQVMLNGQGPFDFVVDSAAGMSLVDNVLVEQLGLPTLGEAHVGDATSQAARPAKIVTLDELRVGEAAFKNSAAVATGFRDLFADDPNPPVGILGFNLFRKLLVTFDYPGGVLRIEGGALPEPDGREILPLKLSRGRLPTVHVALGGSEFDLTIDTGAATCLALTEAMQPDIALAGAATPIGMARRLNTEHLVREARAAADLRLGAHVVTRPYVNFSGNVSVVGYDILRHFAITLDAQNERVRFARGAAEPIALPQRCRTGFAVRHEAGQWRVRYVLEGSPAETAGLKRDEPIRAINGRPCAEYGRGELRGLLTTPGEVKVEVERDGRPVTVVVAVTPIAT
jgi:hypothetical protein